MDEKIQDPLAAEENLKPGQGLVSGFGAKLRSNVSEALTACKLLEASIALDRVYVAAYAYFAGKGRPEEEVSGKELEALLQEVFAAEDARSIDCQSFMLEVARGKLGKAVVTAPLIDKPMLSQFESGFQWHSEFSKRALAALKTDEGVEYKRWCEPFLARFEENSQRISIPSFSLEDQDANFDAVLEAANAIARNCADQFRQGPLSRVLEIFGDTSVRHRALHACIVLGFTPDEKDLIVVDKEELGSSMQVKTLSSIIAKHSAQILVSNLSVNLSSNPWEGGA